MGLNNKFNLLRLGKVFLDALLVGENGKVPNIQRKQGLNGFNLRFFHILFVNGINWVLRSKTLFHSCPSNTHSGADLGVVKLVARLS